MNSFPMRDTYEIRDPIHQLIRHNILERELINSQPFQRLRRIKQLAFTDVVYPGATHTRFLHSLGVMHLAGLAYSVLIEKHGELLKDRGWTEPKLKRVRTLLRLSALLHDIGHPPFSHTAEMLFPERSKGNGKYDHEDYSREVILSPSIREILDKYADQTEVTAQEIVDFLSPGCDGEYRFWRQILIGDLDVDRMDYLNRDSHFCGVTYGVIDHHRILATLTLKDDEDNLSLAIEEGGLNSAEGLIHARYWMFIQVYFHKTRRAYDILLSEFLRDRLPSGIFAKPDNLEQYLEWDDFRVIQEIQCQSKSHSAAEAIVTRRHYREVHSTTDYPSAKEVVEFYEIRDQITRRYLNGDDSALRFDQAWKAPHNFSKVSFSVKGSTSGEFIPIEKVSPVLHGLNPILKLRLYTKPSDKLDEIRTFVKTTAKQWYK